MNRGSVDVLLRMRLMTMPHRGGSGIPIDHLLCDHGGKRWLRCMLPKTTIEELSLRLCCMLYFLQSQPYCDAKVLFVVVSPNFLTLIGLVIINTNSNPLVFNVNGIECDLYYILFRKELRYNTSFMRLYK